MELTKFQHDFFKYMNFTASKKGAYYIFADPSHRDSGLITLAERPGCYTLVYGDYCVPKDFELDFATPDSQLRFGLVKEGGSKYQIINKPATQFMPAPFIAVENHLSGHQTWHEGDTYKGIELFVDMEYILNCSKDFPCLNTLLEFPVNRAILFLPLNIIDILRYLENALLENTLPPLLLEAKILECLALISDALGESDSPFFLETPHAIDITINQQRSIHLNSSDMSAIKRAHHLISENLVNPPTISALCKTLFISEQKLTAGFKEKYHMPIGNYIKELRLSTGANLLSSTNLSIDEISKEVGYSHPSNFAKAFKTKYKRTPLHFRKFGNKKACFHN